MRLAIGYRAPVDSVLSVLGLAITEFALVGIAVVLFHPFVLNYARFCHSIPLVNPYWNPGANPTPFLLLSLARR